MPTIGNAPTAAYRVVGETPKISSVALETGRVANDIVSIRNRDASPSMSPSGATLSQIWPKFARLLDNLILSELRQAGSLRSDISMGSASSSHRPKNEQNARFQEQPEISASRVNVKQLVAAIERAPLPKTAMVSMSGTDHEPVYNVPRGVCYEANRMTGAITEKINPPRNDASHQTRSTSHLTNQEPSLLRREPRYGKVTDFGSEKQVVWLTQEELVQASCSNDSAIAMDANGPGRPQRRGLLSQVAHFCRAILNTCKQFFGFGRSLIP